MHLTKDIIIEASINILDSYGLADMTMRRLATQLHVAPGALYWHFKNKQALIDAIARHMLTPFLTQGDAASPATSISLSGAPEGTFMRDCENLRAIMLGYRDGAELLSAALSEVELREAVEHRLAANLASPQAPIAAATALHFLLGATVLEQTERQKVLAAHPEDDSRAREEVKKLTVGFTRQFLEGIKLIEAGARK